MLLCVSQDLELKLTQNMRCAHNQLTATLHSIISKQMVNYELGKIYKIVCNKTGLIYIGSTCQRLLSQRLSGHVKNFKQWKNGKTRYVTSYTIIENDDFYIELLEAVSCSSYDELAKKERYYIESIDCVNKHIPGRKKQEYYSDNKEIMKDYNKQYREDNKEIISTKKKEYYENNKEKVKQYYENNKEKLSLKIKCNKCGSVVTKHNLTRHKRSLKCQNASDILPGYVSRYRPLINQ